MILPLVDPKVLGGVLDVLAHVYGGSVTRMAAADGVSPAVASADLLSSLGEVQRRAEHAAAGMLLDRLPFALLVVDADGRLLYANASGSALLAAGDRVRLDGDGVHAVRPEEDGVLHSAVAALAVPQPPVRTTESCQLTSAREGRRFGVLAMRAVTEPPAIVLLLADPAREQALRSLLRSLFGMTRSEAELWALIEAIARNTAVSRTRLIERMQNLVTEEGDYAYFLIRGLNACATDDEATLLVHRMLLSIPDASDRQITALILRGAAHRAIAGLLGITEEHSRQRWKRVREDLVARFKGGLLDE